MAELVVRSKEEGRGDLVAVDKEGARGLATVGLAVPEDRSLPSMPASKPSREVL